MNNHLYISAFKRNVIWVIDVLIVSLGYSLLIRPDTEFLNYFGFFIVILYFVLMTKHYQATLGQMLFKLKTVDSVSGNKPSIRQIVLREFYSLLSFTGLGFVTASFTHSFYSGFYWDRWTHIKVIPSNIKLAEFNKTLERERETLFPTQSKN